MDAVVAQILGPWIDACMHLQAIAVTPAAGRPSLAAEEGSSHLLLPCHPMRLDLALVPYGR